MDKRTFIALFVEVILFFVWSPYFAPTHQPAPPQPPASLAADSIKAPAVAEEPQIALPDSLIKGADSLRTLTLANDNFTVSFSNLGASITSIKLKKYNCADKKTNTPVNLVPQGRDLAGISLLQHKASPPKDLKMLYWQSAQSDTAGIVFWLGEKSSPLVTKSYRLDDKYGILMDVKVNSPDAVYGIEYDFSAGIAEYPAMASTISELLSRADQALYAAKNDGRARTYIFRPIMARNDRFWEYLKTRKGTFFEPPFNEPVSKLPYLPQTLEQIINLDYEVRSIGVLIIRIQPLFDLRSLRGQRNIDSVSYTHLRAHETPEHLVCSLLLGKKKTHIHKEYQ